MANTVDEIKSRLSIVDIVSQYVQLKKAGRSYKGLCPFHSEKTPSFVVSPEKEICHCFGCGKGGDIFTFIQEVEGLGFSEALSLLADRAGVKIEKTSGRSSALKSEKEEFFKAHDEACAFFENELFNSRDGNKVLEYLFKRGLNEETIREFRIGFAPDSYDSLYPLLLKKSIKKDVLLKSGLVASKNLVKDNIYDKYRRRLIFPIFDHLGRICGFGGRALQKDQMPKYLNSPENIIYSKSKILYGFSHAKKYIKAENKIILAEGYFDVILPYQEGVRNIVATSGTALSLEQVKFISRFTNNAVTCFDSDKAGMEATERAYVLLQSKSFEVRSVSVKNGKDPADAVLADSKQFVEELNNASFFMDYKIDCLISKHDISDFRDRRLVLKTLLPFLKKLSSVDKDQYIKILSVKLNIEVRVLYDELNSFDLPVDHPAKVQETTPVDNHQFSFEEMIFALILEYPFLYEKFLEDSVEDEFSVDFKKLYKILFDQYNSIRLGFSSWNFEDLSFEFFKSRIDVLLLFAESNYGNFPQETLCEEMLKLLNRFRHERKHKSLKDIEMQIEEAEKNNDRAKLLELLAQQQELLSKS